MLRTRAVLGLPLVLLLVGGCASTGRPTDPGAVTVQIENDIVPPIMVTIYAVRSPANTPLRLIGAVMPASTQRFTFTPELPGNEYRLVARASGYQMASSPILIEPGHLVNWTLSSNIATSRD